MNALGAWVLVVMATSSGCMITTSQTKFVSDGQRQVTVEPAAEQSSVTARAHVEGGIVRGKLEWASNCRVGTEELSHLDVIESKRPNYGAAIGGLVASAFIGGISAAVLSHSKTLSDVDTCSTDIHGDYRCSSPRDDATAVGAVGVFTAAAMACGSMVTFGSKRTSKKTAEIPEPPRLLRKSPELVPCGTGPVEGVGMALYQADRRLAASATNAEGDFALVVPTRTTGTMRVAIESVPFGMNLLRPHVLTGSLEIPAVPEADEPTAAAP